MVIFIFGFTFPILTSVFLSTAGCGVKVEYLPQISYPYVAEMEFLKEVKNVNGKAKKKKFKDDSIYSPFYFLLKIKEIENTGTITVRFYESKSNKNTKTVKKNERFGKWVTEKSFQFGKPGKYYEYVIFFDRVEDLAPGRYRYSVFYNDTLIYEDYIEIKEP
jgi:hypothetical protein